MMSRTHISPQNYEYFISSTTEVPAYRILMTESIKKSNHCPVKAPATV